MFVAADLYGGGDRVIQALRERLGSDVPIMTTEVMAPIPDLLDSIGTAAHGLYVSGIDVPPDARLDSPAGRRFASDFGALEAPVQGLLPAAQAADVLLDAIARSDGTRRSVLEQLRDTRVTDGYLGDFRIDRPVTSHPPRSRSSGSPTGRPPGRTFPSTSRARSSTA